MRATASTFTVSLAWFALTGLSACAPAGETPAPAASGQPPTTRQSYQDWPTGPYQVVENWPKPLPDTRHSHDGWTWG